LRIDTFSQTEVDKAISATNPGKSIGLDGVTLDTWKPPDVRK